MKNDEQIKLAQAGYDALNDEVYRALASIGISDEAMLKVLRISPSTRPSVPVILDAPRVVMLSPTATAKLMREGGVLRCSLAYLNPTNELVTFKRNVAGKTATIAVKSGLNSYSNISISETEQKSGIVNATVWLVSGSKEIVVFSKTFNLKEV